MLLFYLYVLILGSTIGSFLNVCIYRLPVNQSIVYPPSHCMSCGTRLRAFDLIPVLSYMFLGGKCRYCGARFSVRYMLVELLTVFLFLWSFHIVGMGPELIKVFVFLSFLLVITFIDYDHQLILDKVLLWFSGAGVFIHILLFNWSYLLGLLEFKNDFLIICPVWWDMLVAALGAGGFLLLAAVLSGGGMGGGDIKLAAVLGLWLGWKLTFVAMLLAFIIGGITGALLLFLKVKGRKDYIPFGPFLAIGGFISILFGNTIISWYLNNL